MNKALEKWEEKQFESCIENIQYTNKIPKKDFKENGFFPIISQEEEFINGYWDKEKDLFKIKKPLVIFGDHTKNIKYVDFDFVLGADGVKIISTIDDILPKYMYYYLQNIQLRDLGYARHYKLLKEVVVKYPSLSEQQRIVEILDEAFENIEKAKQNALQNLNNAKELFESRLNKTFLNIDKNVNKKLSELAQIIGGGTPSKDNKSFYIGDIPWATVRDMNTDLLTETEFLINEDAVKNSSTNIIPAGNIIIATRVGLGKVCILAQDTAINQDLKGIMPVKQITSKFLFWWFKSIKNKIVETGVGATVKGVKLPFIQNLDVPYIDIKEQQKIVAQLDELQEQTKKLEQIYEQKIKDLDELKQSILQKAFNGEL